MIADVQDIELVLDALQSFQPAAEGRRAQAVALWHRIRQKYDERRNTERAFTMSDQRLLALSYLVGFVLGDLEVEALRGNDPAQGCTTIVLRLSKYKSALPPDAPKHERYEYVADLMMAKAGELERGAKQ